LNSEFKFLSEFGGSLVTGSSRQRDFSSGDFSSNNGFGSSGGISSNRGFDSSDRHSLLANFESSI
jgi:hypothetical protein